MEPDRDELRAQIAVARAIDRARAGDDRDAGDEREVFCRRCSMRIDGCDCAEGPYLDRPVPWVAGLVVVGLMGTWAAFALWIGGHVRGWW
jgi:hypothetical protein